MSLTTLTIAGTVVETTASFAEIVAALGSPAPASTAPQSISQETPKTSVKPTRRTTSPKATAKPATKAARSAKPSGKAILADVRKAIAEGDYDGARRLTPSGWQQVFGEVDRAEQRAAQPKAEKAVAAPRAPKAKAAPKPSAKPKVVAKSAKPTPIVTKGAAPQIESVLCTATLGEAEVRLHDMYESLRDCPLVEFADRISHADDEVVGDAERALKVLVMRQRQAAGITADWRWLRSQDEPTLLEHYAGLKSTLAASQRRLTDAIDAATAPAPAVPAVAA